MRVLAAVTTVALLTLGACSSDADHDPDDASSDEPAVAASTFATPADTHADGDDDEYDASEVTTITLADGASTVDGAGARVDGDTVTVTAAGTYLVSGTLADGQLLVDSPGDGKVRLVLDGAHIGSADDSPLVVTEADEVVVVLADGSANTLADGAGSGADDEETDAPTATLYSMADLTIGGSGSLTVTGASNDGIGSKDGLVVLDGTITVDAADDGIRGKDYLAVEGGTLDVTAGGDGLKADNDAEDELGWIQLDAGTVTVAAGSDGADAEGAINVADGTLTVTRSDEGLEARAITISGGTVDLSATDDGVNATSGSVSGGTEATEEGVLLTISGGTVLIDAGSDGVDSNGSATITGGTTVVTPSAGGGGNGAIDVNGSLTAPDLVTVTARIAAGQRVAIAADDGGVVTSFVLRTGRSSFAVLAGGITAGEDYTVLAEAGGSADSTDGLSEIATATATEASDIATGGFGGGFGGGPQGGQGGGPDGRPGGADDGFGGR